MRIIDPSDLDLPTTQPLDITAIMEQLSTADPTIPSHRGFYDGQHIR